MFDFMQKYSLQRIPWWSKILLKLVLSRFPLSYQLWSSLGVFRHGSNDEAMYGFKVFHQHFNFVAPSPGFVTLELGPGDALASAIVARAYGGSKSYQVDVSPYASRDISVYVQQAHYCQSLGFAVPKLSQATKLEDVLAACNATYLTNGLTSLKEIPTASVDFVYSHSCLEHIRAVEFVETIHEIRRILKPGGGASHSVDFQDHLQGGLNNLRFSSKVWESTLFAKSGFYTNRIRPSEMLSIVRKAGFSAEVVLRDIWPNIPTPRKSLHPDFRYLPDEDLITRRLIFVTR